VPFGAAASVGFALGVSEGGLRLLRAISSENDVG
jgi:hypothetical protein